MNSRRIQCGPAVVSVVLVALWAAGCGSKEPPVARPEPPPLPPTVEPTAPPAPPRPPMEPIPIPSDTINADDINSRSLDELNRDSPLQPLLFALDSSEVSGAGRDRMDANAELLTRYPNWVVTIEGHCDERGTPEYNLALGERRALAARNYLVSLGIAGDRLRTVSYGKEFPFDPGHTDAAWAQNRRAHFVITSK